MLQVVGQLHHDLVADVDALDGRHDDVALEEPSAHDDEEPFVATVRYRTVGDMTCTGAVESTAETLAQIIEEIAVSRLTERGATRADDRISESSMEDRKREGYF